MAEKNKPFKEVYGKDLRLDGGNDYGGVHLEGNATGKSSPLTGPRKKNQVIKLDEETEVEKDNGSYGDKVKEKINYQKKVSITFPEKVFGKLDKFAKGKANDCYWLAIDILLNKYEEVETKDLNTIMLMNRDEQLKQAIVELDARIRNIEGPKEENKKGHFGKPNGKIKGEKKKNEKQTESTQS